MSDSDQNRRSSLTKNKPEEDLSRYFLSLPDAISEISRNSNSTSFLVTLEMSELYLPIQNARVDFEEFRKIKKIISPFWI